MACAILAAMSLPPVACTLSAPDLAQRRHSLLADLLAAATDRRLVGEGAQLTFANPEEVLPLLLEALVAERRCCPFLTFRLTFEPERGPLTLEISGPTGTGEFLQNVLGF